MQHWRKENRHRERRTPKETLRSATPFSANPIRLRCESETRRWQAADQPPGSWLACTWSHSCLWRLSELVIFKARCNGDSLRAGTSSWQVDYRVSDRQRDGKVARVWTRGRAIRVNRYVVSATVATGHLHLPLALAALKLSPLQRALSE
jgi:hypothetical protein